jgi:hypothetical protein
MPVEHRPGLLPRVVVESVSGESRIANVFEHRTIELVAAAPGHQVGDEADVAAVLGSEVIGQHPVFTHGFIGYHLARPCRPGMAIAVAAVE